MATLLAHELAHVRRLRPLGALGRVGDVRPVLVVSRCLMWVRRRLRAAEEECCDAWVVGELPASATGYARALLETVDFLSVARPALPPVASGAGHVEDIKRRLLMIVRGATPRKLSLAGKLTVLALLLLLPLVPTPATSAGPGDAGDKADQKAPPPAAPVVPGQAAPAAPAADDEPIAFQNRGVPLQQEVGEVWQVALSPDGKTVAAAHGVAGDNRPGELKLWDVAAGKHPLADAQPAAVPLRHLLARRQTRRRRRLRQHRLRLRGRGRQVEAHAARPHRRRQRRRLLARRQADRLARPRQDGRASGTPPPASRWRPSVGTRTGCCRWPSPPTARASPPPAATRP